jgi:hypothetical protein
LIADHVGVHPQRDGRIGMTEASRHDMHRHTGKQQSRGVKVPQIAYHTCPDGSSNAPMRTAQSHIDSGSSAPGTATWTKPSTTG